MANAGRDKVAAVGEVNGGAVKGQTIDIVGDDARDRQGKIGETEKRGGGARRMKWDVKHGQWWKEGSVVKWQAFSFSSCCELAW